MSSTMLDSRFFKRITTRTHDGFVYEAYEAVYARSTMVLFSRKTKTPLAALTLKAEDVGCLSMLTGRPSPQGATEPYFQGMLNMSDQVFNFTISNLSDKGMIRFNILHAPHRVSSRDLGSAYRVNQGNALRKNRSCTIEADRRNNRKMILKGKIKRIMDSLTGQEMEVALTVKESETKEEKSTGLYFYLSVVPDRICKELVENFAEGTIWKVVPGFVRQVTAPPIPSPLSSFFLSDHGHRHHSRLAGSADIGCLSRPDCKKVRRVKRLSREAARGDHVVEGNNRNNSNHNSNNNNNNNDNHNLEHELGSVEPVDDVGGNQAADLHYGSHVNVVSRRLRHELAYEHSSEPTFLCMSIWTDMKFLALPKGSSMETELNQEMDEWIKNKGQQLIESLNAIFKSLTWNRKLTLSFAHADISASTMPTLETICAVVPCVGPPLLPLSKRTVSCWNETRL